MMYVSAHDENERKKYCSVKWRSPQQQQADQSITTENTEHDNRDNVQQKSKKNPKFYKTKHRLIM